MIDTLAFSVWDTDLRRGSSLKERLDMFTERETALFTGDWDGTPCNDVCFLSFDDCGEPVIRVAQFARRAGESLFLMLVSDRSSDLTALFRPGIRPSGVLFRPVKNEHLREMLGEIADEMERLTGTETDDVFILRYEGSSRRVLFREILFFEAQNKKVVLHTAGQEIGYYDSIENLSAVLPPYFVRSHRSYIVNARKIEEMRIADMEIIQTGGVGVPCSRSQRDAVMDAMAGVRS